MSLWKNTTASRAQIRKISLGSRAPSRRGTLILIAMALGSAIVARVSGQVCSAVGWGITIGTWHIKASPSGESSRELNRTPHLLGDRPSRRGVRASLGLNALSAVPAEPAAPVQEQGGHVFNVKAYGAKGDGVSDDTRAIQAAHDAMPPGGGVLELPAGIYVCNGPTLSKSCVVRGAGRSATAIMRTIGSVSVLNLSGASSSFAVTDLEINGNQLGGPTNKGGIAAVGIDTLVAERLYVHDCGIPGYTAGHRQSADGIYALSTKQIRVRDCLFVRCERDGVIARPSERVTVENSRFVSCGRLACTADTAGAGTGKGPIRVVYRGNSADSCGSGGFHCETDANANTAVIGDADIDGNLVTDCGFDQWDYGWGIVIGNNMRGFIRSNRVLNFAPFRSIGRITADTNTIVDVTNIESWKVGNGIWASKTALGAATLPVGTTVTGIDTKTSTLTISKKALATSSGMRLHSSRTPSGYCSGIAVGRPGGSVHILGNQVKNCGESGIYVNESKFPISISGNHATDNGDHGISAYLCTPLEVNGGNICSRNYAEAAAFNVCTGMHVTGNTFIDNGQAGAHLYSCILVNSNNVKITDNILGGSLCDYAVRWTSPTQPDSATWISNSVGKLATPNWSNFAFTSTADSEIIGGRKSFRASSPPETGTWAVGDTYWNTKPAEHGTLGWICTTAGKPGTWKAFGIMSKGDAVVVRRDVRAGSPTIAAETGAGTKPIVSISGSDQDGTITISTGTSPKAAAKVATITFGSPFPDPPRSVTVTAANSNAAALHGPSAIYEDSTGRSKNKFVLSIGAGGLSPSTRYLFNYHVGN